MAIKLYNKAIERKLTSGRAIGLSRRPRKGDFYVLERVVDGMDYCNAQTEQWIWSIGRHHKTGEILASHTDEFFGHPNFECLWSR